MSKWVQWNALLNMSVDLRPLTPLSKLFFSFYRGRQPTRLRLRTTLFIRFVNQNLVFGCNMYETIYETRVKFYRAKIKAIRHRSSIHFTVLYKMKTALNIQHLVFVEKWKWKFKLNSERLWMLFNRPWESLAVYKAWKIGTVLSERVKNDICDAVCSSLSLTVVHEMWIMCRYLAQTIQWKHNNRHAPSFSLRKQKQKFNNPKGILFFYFRVVLHNAFHHVFCSHPLVDLFFAKYLIYSHYSPKTHKHSAHSSLSHCTVCYTYNHPIS